MINGCDQRPGICTLITEDHMIFHSFMLCSHDVKFRIYVKVNDQFGKSRANSIETVMVRDAIASKA